MQVKMTHTAKLVHFLVLGCILFGSGDVWSQSKYEIAITDIQYQKVYKNWLRIPHSVDLRVFWAATKTEKAITLETGGIKEVELEESSYRLFIYTEGKNNEPIVQEIKNENHADVKSVNIGEKLSFKVKAFDSQANLLAESAMASVMVGKDNDEINDALVNKNWLYYMHPGRFQLAVIGKAEIFDKSTILGKLAFMFLSITAMISFLVLVFYSARTLYLGNIFPFKRSTKDVIWSLLLSCDMSYANRLTHKFKFVLRAWEMIAAKSRMVADHAVKNIPQTLSSTEKMASVDVACMEYWTHDGDKAIGTIEDIIAYPEYKGMNGRHKSPDDLLSELVIKIEDNFHEIIADSSNGKTNGHAEKQDMKNLIEEIYEPVEAETRLLSRIKQWVLRKGVLDLKTGLRPLPTSRIIQAGLEIHRMGGYRWLKPSEEVKRAFEDRASNEIEILKRKSKIEWFWNYGTLAPLVGLFGTVTGITYAFQQLSKATANPDFVNTIQLLSNGIFEALWTTIFGLANGITFVIIYYYYKHKLDWIYSKWEEIYVTITEKL